MKKILSKIVGTKKRNIGSMLFLFALLMPFFSFSSPSPQKNKEIFSLSLIPLENNNKPEDIRLKYDGFYFLIEKEQFLKTKRQFNFKENYQAESENIFFLPLNKLKEKNNFWFVFETIENRFHYKKEIAYYLNTKTLKEKLQEISKIVKKDSQEGKFEKNEQDEIYLLQEPQEGYQMDADKTLYQIIEGIIQRKNSFFIEVEPILPEIKANEIEKFYFKDLLGKGESNFAGSPANRIHNIQVAVKKFHGLILKPNEEFSFTTILGPVDKENGYKEELVIKQNKTIPEFGGGICQVSTTIFRAALNAGFKITERHNHAYPVQYYSPQGTDATVYVPNPDLRFINDSFNFVLVQAKIEKTNLTFEFWGKSDGRQVEIEGPTVTERSPDGKLKTILYQIVKDKDGNLLRKDTFKSFYDNPNNYHEPDFKVKPENWSYKQWEEYKIKHNLQCERTCR